MRHLVLRAEEEYLERLDVFVTGKLKDLSRTYIQTLIDEGNILVDGKQEKSSYLVHKNDIIEVNIPDEKEEELIPEDIDINVIYEDDYLAVVKKPQGMVVHPGAGNHSGTLANGLITRFDRLSDINGGMRPGIVHRLDKDTEGILLIAKDNDTHEFLSKQFRERTIKRKYKALVHGEITDNKGIVSAPIGRHPIDRQRMAVINRNSKEAISYYEVKERFHKYTLLEIGLKTGRTHQIRVHMEYLNYPIVGDPVYSRGSNEFNLKKQFLYAVKLTFIHPEGDEVTFEIDVPSEGEKILESLRLKNR